MVSFFEKKCRDKGLKMTGQRRIIIEVLDSAKDHPDIEEIFQRAQKLDPRISLPTVYRTMRLFAERQLVLIRDFGDGRGRYEKNALKDEHHDHLIDMTTGKIHEFFHPELERLKKEIARHLGFRLTGHKLELYGEPLVSPPPNSKK